MEVTLNNLKSLQSHGSREKITKLMYKNFGRLETFVKGDLPEGGALKEVDLCDSNIKITSGDIFPQGLESIYFNFAKGVNDEIILSELPSSIKSLSNVTLKKPYSENKIPENITSISFNNRNVDPTQIYDIIIPNSITKLDLFCLSACSELPNVPSPTFIPSSVIDLTTCYNEKLVSNLPVIPSSVTTLLLKIYGDDCTFKKGFIPNGVKELTIEGSNSGNLIFTEGCFPSSITKLAIYFTSEPESGITHEIKPNSIPSSVLDLDIIFSQYPKSFDGIFPNSLIKLEINSNSEDAPVPSTSNLPSTIKNLTIDGKEVRG